MERLKRWVSVVALQARGALKRTADAGLRVGRKLGKGIKGLKQRLWKR